MSPPVIEGATYVGDKVCLDCHANISHAFPASPHARLRAMALGAGFVQARQGEAVCGFHYALAVGIVALHTIHFAFDHRMMLRKMEFSADLQVTLEAGFRVLAGIDDEFCPAAGFDVFAAGTVARFATRAAGQRIPS